MTRRRKKKDVPQVPKLVEIRKAASAVYPAVSSDNLPKVDPPAEEITPPAQPVKSPRKGKVAASWVLQVAIVAIPAAISGLFSYWAGKGDSEAGYKATVIAVKELQGVAKELVLQIAYLQGEVDALRDNASRMHGTKFMRRPPPPPELKVSMQFSTLPTDLGEAVRSNGSMEQQTIVLSTPQVPDAFFTPAEKAVMEETAKKRATAIDEMEKKRKGAAEMKPAAPPH